MILRFYHISHTWKEKLLIVEPKLVRTDLDEDWEKVPCICVTQSIPQTIITTGDILCALVSDSKIYYCDVDHAVPELKVFDFYITNEHRLYRLTGFTYVCDFILPKSIERLIKKI